MDDDTYPVRLVQRLYVLDTCESSPLAVRSHVLPVGHEWDATIDARDIAHVRHRGRTILLTPDLYEVVPEHERDLDRCEVDDCDSTDGVQPELLPSMNRLDPPEWLLVCAHHRAIREDNEARWEAEYDAAAALHDGPDTL